MTRLKILERTDMTEEQGRVYDAVEAAGGPLGGPYYAYIRIPELMRKTQDLRNCLQAGPLSGRERQIVHLSVARHWGAKYPWAAQVRASLEAGLDQAVIDSINANEAPKLDDPRELAAYEVARELLASRGLTDATYAAAQERLGLEDLVAVVASVGQFSMTCCTTNAFGIAAPGNAPTPLIE